MSLLDKGVLYFDRDWAEKTNWLLLTDEGIPQKDYVKLSSSVTYDYCCDRIVARASFSLKSAEIGKGTTDAVEKHCRAASKWLHHSVYANNPAVAKSMIGQFFTHSGYTQPSKALTKVGGEDQVADALVKMVFIKLEFAVDYKDKYKKILHCESNLSNDEISITRF